MIATLVLLAVAAGSWLLRVAFIAFVDVETMPASVRKALDYVAPAVTAALVVTTLADGEGYTGLRLSLPEVAGLLAAAAITVRTGSLLSALLAAMGTFAAVGLLTSL